MTSQQQPSSSSSSFRLQHQQTQQLQHHDPQPHKPFKNPTDYYEYNRTDAWKEQQPRLEDYHTVFRRPHYVTDAEYHRRVSGTYGASSPTDYSSTCLQACTLFSCIATLFLFFIGFLLDVQPLYIPGTLPSLPIQSTVSVNGVALTKLQYQYLIPGSTDERLPAAVTAYHAAWLYAATALLCAWLRRRRQHGGFNYRSVPDAQLPMTTTTTTSAMEPQTGSSICQRAWGVVQRRWKAWQRKRRSKRRMRNNKPRTE